MVYDLYNAVCNFLVSTMLWHLTFDWFHPFITWIVLYFLLRIVMRKSRIMAFIVSGGAQLFAMIIFFAVVMGGVIHGLHWNFDGNQTVILMRATDEFYASLSVALIYVSLQTMYFWIGRWWYHYTLLPYFFIIIISNSIGFMCSYILARMIMIWNYV